MSDRNAIVITFDGLNASFLGPYGNSWVGTPGFDRFASQSLLIEHAIADDPAMNDGFQAFWQGRHVACPPSDQATLATLCEAQGVNPVLFTDHAGVAQEDLGFTTRTQSTEASAEAAAMPEQTNLAKFADGVIENVANLQSPFLLWAHASAMFASWDCPYEMRLRYADAEDPDPLQYVEPPHGFTEDPDELWSHQVAYAAQVALLDACLSVMMNELPQHVDFAHTLVIVTSTRGYPLGEHGVIGPHRESLHVENLHVPLLVRPGNQLRITRRSQAIVQPAAVFATVSDWLGLDVDRRATGAVSLLQEGFEADCRIAFSRHGAQRSVRNADWMFVQTTDAQRLFVKPDDRWEVNEVASRLPDEVQEMTSHADNFLAAARAETLGSFQKSHLEKRMS